MSETITARELSRRLGRTSIERTEEYLRDFEERVVVEQADGGWRLTAKGRKDVGWLATTPLDLDPADDGPVEPDRASVDPAEPAVVRHDAEGYRRGCACERCVEAHERELERQREREERQRRLQSELAELRVTWVEPQRRVRKRKPAAPKEPVRVEALAPRAPVKPPVKKEPKPRVIDMTGQRFGSLTVLRRDTTRPGGKGRQARWLAACDCGGSRVCKGSDLRGGLVATCLSCRRRRGGAREAA